MIVYNSIGDTDPRGDSAGQLATFDVVHPATLDVVHRVQRSTSDDIARAVDTCWSAREAWSSTAVETRAAVVNKAADLLADESGSWSEKLQKANLTETSATLWWAKQQLADVVNFLRCLAEAAPRVFKTQIIQDESCKHSISSPWSMLSPASGTTHIEREPWGVCLAIPAWNAVGVLVASATTWLICHKGPPLDRESHRHSTARGKYCRPQNFGDRPSNSEPMGRSALRLWPPQRLPECRPRRPAGCAQPSSAVGGGHPHQVRLLRCE
jgi:hypothetical protein